MSRWRNRDNDDNNDYNEQDHDKGIDHEISMLAPQQSDAPNATNVILDALPYVDLLDEEYEQKAFAMIEEEMSKYGGKAIGTKKKSSSATILPAIRFRTDIMESEFRQRMESRGNTSAADRYLFLVEQPFTTAASEPGVTATLAEWQDAIKRARVAYEKERIRSILLDIDKEKCPAHWKEYNDILQQELQIQEQLLMENQRAIETVNLRRQQSQQQVGRKIQMLEAQCHSLKEKQRNLKIAIASLEEELESSR